MSSRGRQATGIRLHMNEGMKLRLKKVGPMADIDINTAVMARNNFSDILVTSK